MFRIGVWRWASPTSTTDLTTHSGPLLFSIQISTMSLKFLALITSRSCHTSPQVSPTWLSSLNYIVKHTSRFWKFSFGSKICWKKNYPLLGESKVAGQLSVNFSDSLKKKKKCVWICQHKSRGCLATTNTKVKLARYVIWNLKEKLSNR